MGVEWTFAYLVIFLQALAGLVLLRVRAEPRFAIRIFGALFLLNAGVSAIMALPRDAALWFAADAGMVSRSFRALDAPTGPLLLAFLAARSRAAWGRPVAWALIA
ncbi:MAG TPA: hypothetical protein VM582_00985, partial [Candidatus Thermoplasmatota archaeon]|nr:hypothetical protein [Candidatus Thermoplasmatota archaeon]